MFKVLLWDIDGTVLNFKIAEYNGMKAAFEELGLGTCTDEKIAEYSAINNKYWERLEKGEITKNQVLIGRFEEFIAINGYNISAKTLCETYEGKLADTIVPIENSIELLQELSLVFNQYAVTNGAFNVQRKKLANSGLDDILDGSFISDSVGYEKPSSKFFDYVFDNIIKVNKDEILIIGDSLTSDMTGGNNAGIKTCWYNPNHYKNTKGVNIDYEISILEDIKNIIFE